MTYHLAIRRFQFADGPHRHEPVKYLVNGHGEPHIIEHLPLDNVEVDRSDVMVTRGFPPRLFNMSYPLKTASLLTEWAESTSQTLEEAIPDPLSPCAV